MARPTKLTPELTKKLADLVAAGVEVERAAACVGISPKTLERWRAKGRDARSGLFREFELALYQADAQAEVRDVLLVGKAAQTNWKAAAWRLERRTSQRWGPKRPIEPPTGASPDELAFKIRAALKVMHDSVPGPPTEGKPDVELS